MNLEPSPEDLVNSICVRTPHWELEIDGRFSVDERARIIDNIKPFVEGPENIHDFAAELEDERLADKVIAATRRVSRVMEIMVSYRRDDSGGYTGRLYDRLVKAFGKDRVFMDIDTMEPGDDFSEVVSNTVDTCHVLIAVIGKQWVSRRLKRPNDFVRLEISGALNRGIRVIPVLVGGAKMVKANDLPDDLKNLTKYQALEIGDSRFHEDVDRLIKTLKGCQAHRGQF